MWVDETAPSWVLHYDNGTEVLHLAGRRTELHSRRAKGTIFEGGFACPAMIRWPGKGAGRQG